jgi:D-lactate dehydrogenase
MKLAFFDAKPYDKPGFDAYLAETDWTVKYFETKLNEDTVQLAKGFDGVCVFVNDTVNAAVVDALYGMGVRVIALRCAGFNNVDTRACFGKLHVFRVPAYSPYAVAEHAMALLLTVNRHTNKAYIRTRDFNFSLSGLTGFDLHGKTVGVVGTGKIGRIFADICRGFGMRVLAYDKFPNPDSGLTYVELPELLEQADVISLHCPLTDDTRHLIDADAIARMKIGVVIVNTSRGGLVDTEALIEGLRSRKVGAACLDVYEEEGDLFYEDRSDTIIEDDTLVRLIAMPNVIVTSHQAFLTKEALHNIAQTTVGNLVKFQKGEPSPDTEVCYHCARKEACRKERNQKCF